MGTLISVLMSVHNEPLEFIDVAVNSICSQTYKNIEFIIIDDNSDIDTYNHLKRLSDSHSNIKLYRNEKNLGLTATLNRGLSVCTGDFIARMDADDYSCPQRIAEQVEYLNKYPEIDIVGTGVVTFGKSVMFMSPLKGYSPEEVQSNLFFSSSLCHPSVMIRKSFLCRTGLTYDESVKKGQDYDLWERASLHGNLAVLKNVLLYYRLHSRQITSVNRIEQDETLHKIMLRRLNRINILPTEEEKLCHLALIGQDNSASIIEIKAWINKILEASSNSNFITYSAFKKNLKRRYVLSKLKRRISPSLTEIPIAIKILWSRLELRYMVKKMGKRINYELFKANYAK